MAERSKATDCKSVRKLALVRIQPFSKLNNEKKLLEYNLKLDLIKNLCPFFFILALIAVFAAYFFDLNVIQGESILCKKRYYAITYASEVGQVQNIFFYEYKYNPYL